MLSISLVIPSMLLCAAAAGDPVLSSGELVSRLTPQPQRLELRGGSFTLRGASLAIAVPEGPEHEACRTVLEEALRAAGATVRLLPPAPRGENRFAIGAGCATPPLPTQGPGREAYSLAVGPAGISAVAASPTGLLYAAQTLRQLARVCSEQGRLPGLTVVDYPEFRTRGIYIEGGQERFGRIVAIDYLREQVRRLSEFKMNTLVIECYNLFPFASFPACADAGTLSRDDCRALVAEARRYHVTLVPSLQTLAQASELVWGCDAGKPYRELTAPGQMCPSTPEVYPFIKGLYRDLLQLFDTTPILGVGCSEIDMQWQGHYCPRCQQRVSAGATVRDLMLGHAEKCIQAVQELATELKRPVRPLMWGDEFYMYGPGKDWVGIERIPRDTVMGYWKYWADYKGIGGLMDRGYDVLGISAMYNHSFYLADLSPGSPKKSWPPMEQTGTRNIAQMVQEAATVRKGTRKAEFLGAVTASFSKHRLRAFDSIWYGFVLNGHRTWSQPRRLLDEEQDEFTRAFVAHYYDCRTRAAADALAAGWTQLDACKSQLELANQTLHDVVGVYDTQEPGYQGNTLLEALRRCRKLAAGSRPDRDRLEAIGLGAMKVQIDALSACVSLVAQRQSLGRTAELDDLLLAGEKIMAHAEREVLLTDTETFLELARRLPLTPAEVATDAAAAAQRWTAHRRTVEAIAAKDARLDRRDDPCGHQAVLHDIAVITAHLADLARPQPRKGPAATLLDERFATLDTARWTVLGSPRVAGGHLETAAPGGWDRRCGIATRAAFALETVRPLVVEFRLTPVKMGVDSQLFESASEHGSDSYRFSFYGPRDRFGVYTQSQQIVSGPWLDTSAGWRLRAQSGPVEPGKEYRIRAEIQRGTFRVVVRLAAESDLDVPFWDSGAVPMDALGETHLGFVDVEPPGSAGESRWGPIVIRK